MKGAGGIAAFLLLAAPVAHASPSARLVYVRGTGADACPPEADLRKAVAQRLGYDPFFPAASKTVVAKVKRTATGFGGNLQIVSDEGKLFGERDIATAGDDCRELVTSMALAISIALDDLDSVEPKSAPREEVAAPPPPEPAPTPAPPKPREPDRPPPAPAPPGPASIVQISVGPTFSIGTAPAPTVGGSVAVSSRWGAFALRVDGRFDGSASDDLGGGAKLTTTSVIGSITGCVRGDLPFVCLGGALGSFSTRTDGIPRPATDAAVLVLGVARAGADVALSSRFFVEVFAEGALNATPHEVDTSRGVPLYSLPIASGTGGVHLGGRFF